MTAYNRYPTDFTTYYEFRKIFKFIPEEDRREWAKNLTAEQLRCENDDGWTVAHTLANKKILPEESITKELLFLADRWDRAVAHELAFSGRLPEHLILSPDEAWAERLVMLSDCGGKRVVHGLAASNTLPRKYYTHRWLSYADENGFTPAHILAKDGNLPEECWDSAILSIPDTNGWTVSQSIGECIINNRWDLLIPKFFDLSFHTLDMNPVVRLKIRLSKMKDEEFAAAVAMMPKETKNLLLSHYGLHPFSKIITDDLEKETEKEVFEIFSDGENAPRETDDSCVPPSGGQDLYSEGQADLYGARSER